MAVAVIGAWQLKLIDSTGVCWTENYCGIIEQKFNIKHIYIESRKAIGG